MREIKFRAWDKKTKHLYPSDYFDRYKMYFMSELNTNLVLMQYTGLKDDSDPPREIYEGDILKDHYGIYEVCFDDSQAAFCVKYVSSTGTNYLFNIAHLSKIIGNIYENPELMI